MATTSEETGRHIALVDIRVPDNVRELDPEHVKALAGSIGLQGMLVPVVVRNDGEGFELVAGFHRVAAARSLSLTAVPVVIRDAQTEDADRAVENIASCRRRHEVIYADRVDMPMSELKCPTARCERGGEVGIRTRTDPGSQAAADGLAEVGGCRSTSKSERATGTRRHARVSSLAVASGASAPAPAFTRQR
jgi:ParB family chromosome partitioning protein